MLFSVSFESFCLSEFLHLDDKKRFMLGRLVVSLSTWKKLIIDSLSKIICIKPQQGSLLELAVILLGYFYYNLFTAYPALAIYLFINMSYNVLVVFGYFVTPNNRTKGEYKPAETKKWIS